VSGRGTMIDGEEGHRWSRSGDLNPGPPPYHGGALPLSYSGAGPMITTAPTTKCRRAEGSAGPSGAYTLPRPFLLGPLVDGILFARSNVGHRGERHTGRTSRHPRSKGGDSLDHPDCSVAVRR
jgi:hypothetical protein